ncbi:hypothetical protein [Chitinophaga sp. sic0106]|uniref:hypothetical protein n=1 Tax=Chitinophaga sp. sic0106 TaxID=2854785 RepID=UPI001C48100A|nr:hypothetical protein [Chitinophaga sp. sic0106]MBV7530549.1 hypothetical protein [Chitinophaga sp. sic0106]
MNGLLRRLVLAVFCLLVGHALHAQNCTINAGVTTSVCPNDKFILSGSSSGLIAIDPVWTQVSGPAVTIKQPNALTTEVSGYAAGMTYKFRLSAKCKDGSLIYDEVTYNTYPATQANAGTDASVCGTGIALHGNTPGTGETGLWTIQGNPNGISFSTADQNKPNMSVNVDPEKAGTAVIRWTISSNNSCRSFDEVTITNPGGVMPVKAGADQTLNNCYTTTQETKLAATFGGNNTNGQQGTWSVLSGPTVPQFSDINDNKATVKNLSAGTYKLRWTVKGPCANGTADVTIVVPTGTQSITKAEGGTATYCDGRNSTVIKGLAPAYAGEIATWTKESGAGTIASPNSPTTAVNNLDGNKSVFVYTISNPATGCTSEAKYTVNYTTPPQLTAPSPVVAPCDATLVTVNYSYTGGDKTQWALISAPAGVTTTAFQDAAQPLLLPAYNIPGTYLVRLKRTTNNGFGGCQDQYADVYVQLSQSPTAANAGTKQVLACNIKETHLAGNIPAVGTGSWSQVSGPAIANIDNKKDPTTLIDKLENGTYTFRWIISGGVGCPNQQADVQVVVASRTPTAAAAGSDAVICSNTPYKLTGNKPVLNETGRWSVSPADQVTFSDPTDPEAIVNGLTPEKDYTFTWTITNGCGTASDQVTIRPSTTAGPKQANAGPDICLAAGATTLTLAGNAATDGETGKWSVANGSTIQFTNDAQNNTGVTGATNGHYQLEWKLSRNGCPDTKDTVLVSIVNTATTATAGSNQNLCGAQTIHLNGNTPSVGTGRWSQLEGPGGIVIADPASNTTAVNNLTDGRYIFRWTISNGACPANFSDVTFNITTPPTPAEAGTNKTICGATTAVLEGNTITNGIGTWSVVSGPSNPTFADAGNPTTTISNLKTGVYKLKWTANSGPDCPVSSDEVVLTVRENAKVTPAVQQICNVTSAVVSGNEGSIGSWKQTAGPAGATIAANASNSAVISNLIPGNQYQFTYTIAAVQGCDASSATATINISDLPSAANAGPDQTFCLPAGASTTDATLAATTPTNGTGMWTLASKPENTPDPQIINAGSINAVVKNLHPGIYVYAWTVSKGNCSSNTDVMRIIVSALPSPALPGADQTNACIDNILLNATAPAVGIGTWSFESAPAGNTAVIEGINAPSTKVLGTKVGQYAFRWTVSNGICPSNTAVVNVNVTSTPPNPAVANVGNVVNGQQCILSGSTTTISLNANAPQGAELGKWIITKGDGSAAPVTFTAGNPATTVSNVGPGDYLMRWTIESGSCTSVSDLPVTVHARPTAANAGTDQGLCLYSPLTLAANTPAVGTGKWSILSQPAGSKPAFSNDADPVASISGLQAGFYQLQWTVTNGVCPVSTDNVNITVDDCGIKVVKTASTPVLNTDGSYNVTFTFKLKNPGTTVRINNVQLTDYIPAGLPPTATYTVESHTITGISGYNGSFNGNTDINLLQANAASLDAGAEATITITIKVKFF